MGAKPNLQSEQQSAMKYLENLLDQADVHINGSRPWDIQVHNPRLYNRILHRGSLGLGESYMDGWWDAESPDEFFNKILRHKLDDKVKITAANVYRYVKAIFVNLQTPKRASKSILHHYDIGQDLYEAMLDKRMVYTCALWNQAKNLDEAQEAKLELVCQKLRLKPGDRILDIGCGWGSFARFAAERYDVHVTGVTLSPNQVQYAQNSCKNLPVEIRLQDYRAVDEKFDHIVSLGMMEHVGYKNYDTYMKVIRSLLKEKGLFLLQVIGRDTSARKADPWINKYIFPDGMLPSIRQIGQAIEKKLVMEDWQNFGPHYDKTLLEWFQNFDSNWEQLKTRYDDRFYRMWKYYLLCCAGAFRSRTAHLWQIVLSKNGIPGGYEPVRVSGMKMGKETGVVSRDA